MDIGDGYQIFRANTQDIVIIKGDEILLGTMGPIVLYQATPEYIFTKHAGLTPRNLFEDDTFYDIDKTISFFYILNKVNDKILGPFPEDKFLQRPEVIALGTLDMKRPKNPNFWTPLLGTMMFLGFMIIFFATKYFWVSIPLFIGTLILVRRVWEKRKEKKALRKIAQTDKSISILPSA